MRIALGADAVLLHRPALLRRWANFWRGSSRKTSTLWEQRVEPRLGMNRERIALSAAILMHLSLAFLTLVFGMLLFERASAATGHVAEIAQVGAGHRAGHHALQPAAAVCILHAHARAWIVALAAGSAAVAVSGWCCPSRCSCSFLLSIAALAETPQADEDDHKRRRRWRR